MKNDLKQKAIDLRKKGFTYSEILENIPVARSTLSVWLRAVGLSKKQYQRITYKKLKAAKKGAKTRKLQRIKTTKLIKKAAKSEIRKITHNELKLIGTSLYWAEGSKEKEYKPGTGIIFSNSDSLMIQLFIKWLKECLSVQGKDLYFELFIHENHKSRVAIIKNYWSKVTGYNKAEFDRIYFKRNKTSNISRDANKKYFGLLRVRVKKSSSLNRKVAGWIEGICLQCGIV